MEEKLLTIATKFWPDLETMSGQERASNVGNVIGFLYTAPLVLVGLVWLVIATDATMMRAEWLTLSLLFVLLLVFSRFDFFLLVEIAPGGYSDFQSSFELVITWSAALIFGPSALWLTVFWLLIVYARRWRESATTSWHWSCLRNLTFNLASTTLVSLIALALYKRWADVGAPDGVFPLPGLMFEQTLPAFGATFVWWLLESLIWLPRWLSSINFVARMGNPVRVYLRFWVIVTGLSILIAPFAILAAGLYTEHGLGGYLFFIAGVLLASLLAHQLSQAAERSQQRSRELEKLERLGRAIIHAPPDASTLPSVLEEHISNMFPLSLMEIRIFPAQTLIHHVGRGTFSPDDHPVITDSAWEWVRATSEARYFFPGEELPWKEQTASNAVVVAPILDAENASESRPTPIGGIYLARRWNAAAAASLLPAVQSLAAQIASALHRAKTYQVEQEIAVAGKIQASFLPDELPHIPGWQLAATLEPARETSGDFYDVILLPNSQVGILIADVADKGTGAALYMALSRTLIRTYAPQYHSRPDYVLKVANRRILTDTRTDLFVTVFYGIIDTITGTLTYCNAGHNPPYLFRGQNNTEAQALTKTGMALGVVEDAAWEQRTVQLAPGDLLILYTDGITDAENGQGAFFGEERLLEIARANLERPAQDVHHTLMTEIHRFVGDAPQFDDITLMTVVRSSTEQQ